MLSKAAQTPDAVAQIRGGAAHPGIRGTVKFYSQCGGTLITADICGLPETETDFFAFHIHEGSSCGGEDFADSKGHYNPQGVPHPSHAGDLPPLLAWKGKAHIQVFTGRFRVSDVIGRTVIIHEHPDDFHTQPAGNPGQKIACGVIHAVR